MKKIIFSDFDGTLTDNHLLGPVFFDIIALIENAGAELVIVTGRSVSWGHFFLTHFPLQACIVEGGGVILYKDDEGQIKEKLMVSKDDLQELADFHEKLVSQVANCPVSADSYGRKSDRALELSLLTDKIKEKVLALMYREKISFYQSNVHLNYWKGNVSKSKAVGYFLEKFRNNVSLKDCIYFGDALNDQSMFEMFDDSVGVSNISECWNELDIKPSVRLSGDENRGPYGVFNYLSSLK